MPGFFRTLFVLELILQNDYVTVGGDYTPQIINLINEECSYYVPNSEWSDKFQSGSWDGKISIFNKKAKRFPSGIIDDVKKVLTKKNISFTVIDKRNPPSFSKKAKVDLGEHSFRDYQEKAIKITSENERGILALCTGGGKTKLSCGIISEHSAYPVIFVVPSVSLLKQTAKEFENSLKPLSDDFSIGKIGGGEFVLAENGVNVCTYHTLLTAYNQKFIQAKNKIVDIEDKTSIPMLERQLKSLEVDLENMPPRKKKGVQTKINATKRLIKQQELMHEKKAKIRELIDKCQLLIIDETHLAVGVIELISSKCRNAYFKYGLSATPMRLDNQEKRMHGATGPILMRVTATDLINKGYLVKPYIYMIDMDLPSLEQQSYAETYKAAVVNNTERNNLIRDFSIDMKASGRPTLIMIERLEHGKILQELIPDCVFVPGGDGSDDSPISDEEMDYRRYQLNRLERNEIIMAATSWAFTGVDAPAISCLILGCSVGSEVTVMQQVGRVLRKCEKKDDCVIIDLMHKEKSLHNHDLSRAKAYAKEQGFEVKILKYNTKKKSYL